MDFPQKGVLHHMGDNNQQIFYNSIKSGIDMDALLDKLKEIQP